MSLARINTTLCCHTVEQTVSANQEIHNYYEEVSTHIKYKLTEHKGLTSAWQQQQHAATAVQAAEAAVLASLNEVCVLMHPKSCLCIRLSVDRQNRTG